ncbi:MAG: type II toxin-antitoxin system prevent-host-death family antitoxin [Candidatus Kapabacteria bacterium]|nr:type II toxin-antitoxin system prevent-host-death family antitoxin [Candidatus Kapabacteria bacterium]
MDAAMIMVNVHEAKTTLSALLAAVERGEEVVIARNGEPVAKLVHYVQEPKVRRLGCAMGSVLYMAEDFDAPLDDFDEYQ